MTVAVGAAVRLGRPRAGRTAGPGPRRRRPAGSVSNIPNRGRATSPGTRIRQIKALLDRATVGRLPPAADPPPRRHRRDGAGGCCWPTPIRRGPPPRCTPLTEPAELPTAAARPGDPLPGVPAPPALLVCTHAERDPCCGTDGRALVDALAAAGVPDVWECSHLGGHRFAATALVLPTGYLYGHLDSTARSRSARRSPRERSLRRVAAAVVPGHRPARWPSWRCAPPPGCARPMR